MNTTQAKKAFQFWITVLTLHAFILNPLGMNSARANEAEEYKKVCDPVFAAAGSTEPNAVKPGSALMTDCTNARMASQARAAERAKLIIYGVALATDVAGMAIEMSVVGSPAAHAMCKFANLAASAAGMGTDFIYSAQMSSALGQYQSLAQTAADSFVGLSSATAAGTNLLGIIKGGSNNIQETLQHALIRSSDSDKIFKAADCIVAGAMMGIELGLTRWGLSSANKAITTATNSARTEVEIAQRDGARSFGNLGGAGSVEIADPAKSVAAKTVGAPDPCSTATGNDYLKCTVGQSPETAAITSDPGFLNLAQKALGGKSLGDFAKGFTGNTPAEAAAYVASGLGLSGDAAAKLTDTLNASDRLAKDSGMLDKYVPMTYSRAPTQVAAVDSSMDFGKMMGDMMNKLNPDGSSVDKTKDPVDIVFRQLDLLPPDKIEANKNISLFARIGYRYRKKSNDVEALNWASEQNQAASTATRGVASQTK